MLIAGFEASMAFYAFVGVAISFGKAKEADKKALGLSPILSRIIPYPRGLLFAEMVVFIAIGCMISLGITNPSTVPQALAAGLAWTGLAMGKASS